MNILILFYLFSSLSFDQQEVYYEKGLLSKSDFNIQIQKASTDEKGNSIYSIQFLVPELSDEILKSESILCEGWMPTGADIEKIMILSIEGIPQDHTWSCSNANCTWEGGSSGEIKLKIKEPEKQGKYDILVNIKGLGSYFGIKRWYTCKLKLEV